VRNGGDFIPLASFGSKFEIRSTCLREAASAKAGEIRNKHEYPKYQSRSDNFWNLETGFACPVK
jgi:hypothetical protein